MPIQHLAGLETHVEHFGQGPRRALLLHCSLGYSGAYAALGAHLGGALSITAFDQPGHGRSADWDGTGDLQDQVTAIARELLDEPMDVIGHSFGGTVALRLAITHPELVRTLTLIEPPMMAVAKADDPTAAEPIAAAMKGFNTALDAGDRETAAQIFTGQYGDGRPWEKLNPETRKAIADRIHLIRAGAPAVQQDVHGLLAPEKMARAAMPALIMDSGGSGVYMSAVQAGLTQRLPDATLVRVAQKGAGHMLPITHPDAVSAEILRLISRAPIQ